MCQLPKSPANRSRRGHAVVEIALMAPWIFLLFIAIFNFGFYAYAAIATANAARIAALATAKDAVSAIDQPTACTNALEEMRMLPNIAALPPTYPCNALPLVVTVTNPAPPALDDPAQIATRVAVTYQTVQLFPLPYMMGRMTLTRVAEMKVYGN
jgi:Flp pilus assembly protein TadG